MKETLYTKVLVRHSTSIFQNYNEYKPKKIKNIETNDVDLLFDNLVGPVHNYYNRKFTLLSKSDKESDFLENYGNPLARVEMSRTTIFVEHNEGKTVIKVFDYSRVRIAGSKFFRVKTHLKYIGFNSKTNTFYSGHITNYHKKRKFSKAMRKNSFWKSPCAEMKIYIRNVIGSYLPKQINFSSGELIEHPAAYSASEIFDVFFKKLNINRINGLSEDDLLYKLYLDNNNIKYSNNWNVFRNVYPSPTKKDLKKYKNKFIDTFMGMRKLSGDKLKRVLHKVESIEIGGLDVTFSIFGKDYILSQEDNIIKKIIETQIYLGTDCVSQYLLDNQKEKHNAFEIFKLVLIGEININTFYDHIRFLNRLRPLENVKWKSNNYDSFLDEHYNWTEKLESYSNGNFKRLYSDEFKNTVEVPILTKYGVVYSKLLTDSREYNYESFIQSNCVKTYLRREGSVIVSLRKGDIESKDRATIEYKIWHNGERVIKLARVQSLGRFNNKLDETWDYTLECLDKRLDDLVDKNKFELPSVILEVGAKKFYTKLVVDNDDRFRYNIPSGEKLIGLKWETETITDNNSLANELGFFF